jgi:hypothetical protein
MHEKLDNISAESPVPSAVRWKPAVFTEQSVTYMNERHLAWLYNYNVLGARCLRTLLFSTISVLVILHRSCKV